MVYRRVRRCSKVGLYKGLRNMQNQNEKGLTESLIKTSLSLSGDAKSKVDRVIKEHLQGLAPAECIQLALSLIYSVGLKAREVNGGLAAQKAVIQILQDDVDAKERYQTIGAGRN